MAEFVENVNDKEFPNARIGKTPFLSSIRDFAPDGILLGVERVSRLFPVKQDPEKAQLMVEFMVMEDVEKIRLYDLDENGKYIVVTDELTGKDQKKLVIGSISEDDAECFPFFMPCGKPSEISNDAKLVFYPTSSAYPLFKFALQNALELPEDAGNKPFATTQEELKDALEGLVFRAKCEEIKGKYSYMRLNPEKVEE